MATSWTDVTAHVDESRDREAKQRPTQTPHTLGMASGYGSGRPAIVALVWGIPLATLLWAAIVGTAMLTF